MPILKKGEYKLLMAKKIAPFLYILLLVSLFCLNTGCEQQDQEKSQIVRLDKLSPLPPPPSLPRNDTLRVAVAAILSPQGTIQSYQPFLHYLEKKIGKSVVLIQRKTYQEINDLLTRRVVDVAFVCTGAYIQGKENMELLVIPQVDGKVTYRSLLIVPAASAARSINDLYGKVFAFTDPLSNTGYLYPLSVLKAQEKKPETFFARTIFTYSHDRSIAAVMEGVADGAAVDNIIYDFSKRRDPQISVKTKVIRRSEEFGMPPVVVPLRIDPSKKQKIKDIFLGTYKDEEGRKALETMGVDRFVEPKQDLYLRGN